MKPTAIILIFFFLLSNVFVNAQSTSESTAEQQITIALNDYINGTTYNQKEVIKRAFHEGAMLYLTKSNEAWNVSVAEYANAFNDEKRGMPNGRVGSITSIQVFGDVAYAEVEILIPSIDTDFTDLILLKRNDNVWKIAAKTASREKCKEPNCGYDIPQPAVSLTKAWETDTLLTNVESLVYDAKRNIIYTSNMNGRWDVKNGLATIGKIDLEGNIVDAEWVKGMEATTGITIHNDHLFVADFGKLVEIDLATGQIVKKHIVDGATRLNDIEITSNGTVFLTDTQQKKLYRFKNNKTKVIAKDLADPNGILLQGSTALVGLMGSHKVIKIDLKNGKTEEFSEGILYPDGIASDGKEGFFVSSFEGTVYHVDANGKPSLLLNHATAGTSTADLIYLPQQQLLLVPSLGKSKVFAYKVAFN